MQQLGLLTWGDDAPGLNAVIRAAVKTASNAFSCDLIGIQDGAEDRLGETNCTARGIGIVFG